MKHTIQQRNHQPFLGLIRHYSQLFAPDKPLLKEKNGDQLQS